MGGVTSFSISEYIDESNKIEGIYDPDEIVQSAQAWDFLKDKKSLSDATVCRVQKLITANQRDLQFNQRGQYRNVSKTIVTVGGRLCPAPLIVPDLMHNWLLDMKQYKHQDPIVMHIRFEKIHPFADGNGRTGRMLLWWHELKLGRKPTLFYNDVKHEVYYRLFK